MPENEQPNDKPSLPLPPRKTAGDTPKFLKPIKSVAKATGQVVQRVNQELYKRNAELAVRNKTLALLRKLDEISLATSDLKEMARKITAAIAAELGYDIVAIAMIDNASKTVDWLSFSSAIDPLNKALQAVSLDQLETPLSSSLVSVETMNEEKPHFTETLDVVYPAPLIKQIEGVEQEQKNQPIKESILQPLRFGQHVLGLMVVSASRSLKNLSQYEQEAVTGLTGLVALALYKAKIYADLQATSAKLTETNFKLQELDKVKSEFLSTASHQLYTPLTALRGYLSMLLEGDFGSLMEKQKPIFDILNKSAERLIALIRDLLDISRIESGRLELKLESVDLSDIAKTLVGDLMPNVINKKLKLNFNKPPQAMPPVVVDTQRIRQVMLNFIDNAIKYTSKGQIDVNFKQESDELIFSVTDTGRGLSKEEIVQLFTKFTRVGGSRRFHTEGTGLGLYVAKQIVNEHHGDVGVASPGHDQGSTFSMRLPIKGSPRSLKLGDQATVTIKAA